MELKAGYKQTEVGVIPEDWVLMSYGEAFNFLSTAAYSRADLKVNEYASYIHYGDIHTLWNHFVDFDEAELPTISKEQCSKYSTLKDGDLIVADASEDYEGIGKTVEVKNIRDKIAISGLHTFLLRSKTDDIANGFKGYIHTNKQVKQQFDRLATGLKVYGVTKTNLKKVVIPLPPTKTEQTAIANALSDVDALIQSLARLIAKKRQIKQGAMQTLLSPYENGRLKAGWVVKKMPEVCWYQEGPGVRNSQFTKSGVKLLNGTNIQDGKLLLEKTNRYISEKEAYGWYSHFLADKGDILIACSGITVDKFHEKVTVLKAEHLPLCMNTSTMRFKVTLKYLLHSYLIHFLRSRDFKDQIGGKATGSAQLNFGPSHVNAVDINLPPIKEQDHIATTLSDMDADIAALETKLAKTQQIKQGIMQELLTGKIRLVTSKAKVVSITSKIPEPRKHNEHFNEAVVIAILADKFGSHEYPLGRKRYTKLSYLLHRYSQESIAAYKKKAAGPYNSKTRYSGAEKIAINNQYISVHKSGKFTGFIAADNIDKAYIYYHNWYGKEASTWLEQFRMISNDTLELWSTVDMAMVELNIGNMLINLESVKGIIASNTEWRPKLKSSIFSDDNIVKAINKSQSLFSC